MLKTIFLGLLTAIAAFAIYIAAQPSEFSVKREAVIPAPPDAVFAQVSGVATQGRSRPRSEYGAMVFLAARFWL